MAMSISMDLKSKSMLQNTVRNFIFSKTCSLKIRDNLSRFFDRRMKDLRHSRMFDRVRLPTSVSLRKHTRVGRVYSRVDA